MCDMGLFYFSKSITDTPPQVTCMRHFKTFLDQPAKMMSETLVVAAILALLLSILHCLLLDREE